MLNLPNILLCFMLLSYINPIYIVYNNYNNNYTISEIITNDKIKYKIFFSAMLMGIFTIIYEFYRNYYSLLIITFLLIGIIGVIFTEEKKNIFCYHNIFAFIAFLSINIFMIFHAYNKSNNILFLLFLLQILFILLTLKNIYFKIFYYECIMLFNFFIFYIYLHLLK